MPKNIIGLLTIIDQIELIILRVTTLILLVSVCAFVVATHLKPYFDEANGRTEAAAEGRLRKQKPALKKAEPRRDRRLHRPGAPQRRRKHRIRGQRPSHLQNADCASPGNIFFVFRVARPVT